MQLRVISNAQPSPQPCRHRSCRSRRNTYPIRAATGAHPSSPAAAMMPQHYGYAVRVLRRCGRGGVVRRRAHPRGPANGRFSRPSIARRLNCQVDLASTLWQTGRTRGIRTFADRRRRFLGRRRAQHPPEFLRLTPHPTPWCELQFLSVRPQDRVHPTAWLSLDVAGRGLRASAMAPVADCGDGWNRRR